jgi:hypothetical protein
LNHEGHEEWEVAARSVGAKARVQSGHREEEATPNSGSEAAGEDRRAEGKHACLHEGGEVMGGRLDYETPKSPARVDSMWARVMATVVILLGLMVLLVFAIAGLRIAVSR